MAKKGKPDTGKTVKSVRCKISLWLRRVRKPKAYLSPGISAKGFMGEPTLATSRDDSVDQKWFTNWDLKSLCLGKISQK